MSEIPSGNNSGAAKNDPPKYLRRHDIAKKFGVTARTILRWEGKYAFPPPMRIGGTAFWLPEDLETFTQRKIAEREERERQNRKPEHRV